MLPHSQATCTDHGGPRTMVVLEVVTLPLHHCYSSSLALSKELVYARQESRFLNLAQNEFITTFEFLEYSLQRACAETSRELLHSLQSRLNSTAFQLRAEQEQQLGY